MHLSANHLTQKKHDAYGRILINAFYFILSEVRIAGIQPIDAV